MTNANDLAREITREWFKNETDAVYAGPAIAAMTDLIARHIAPLIAERDELWRRAERIEAETCPRCNYMRSIAGACKCGQFSTAGTNDQLRQRVQQLREALEQIAKPRLGGKFQQYAAQHALEALAAKQDGQG